MRWYKNTVRRQEITMLMQGLVLPNPRPCAASPLPSVMERPTSPPPLPVEPFEFHEPVDTYGQARVRRRGNILVSSIPPPPPGSTATPMLYDVPVLATTTAIICTETIYVTPVLVTTPMLSVTPPLPATTTTTTDVTTVPLPATEVTVVNVSRTTEWRRKKGVGVPKTPRKGYACGICGRHKSSKHFQNKLHVARYVFLIWQKQQDTLSTFQSTLRGNGTAHFRRYPRRRGLPQLKWRNRLWLLPPLPSLTLQLPLSLTLLLQLLSSPLPCLKVTLMRCISLAALHV